MQHLSCLVFILLAFISQICASKIPVSEVKMGTTNQKFKVLITERGTRFEEKIEIDEEEDVEYFEVPAHNSLPTTEYLYDFKNNVTITRVRSKGVCYISPLPEDLPRPADLKNGLQRLGYDRPSQNITVSHKFWAVRDQVDKTTLRREVRDFCDLYPVNRLQEYDPDSVFEKETRSGRIRRDIDIRGLPMCHDVKTTLQGVSSCSKTPDTWIFVYMIIGKHCTYWATCNHDLKSKKACPNWKHKFDSMICYVVKCP